jgi:hypothetical protein
MNNLQGIAKLGAGLAPLQFSPGYVGCLRWMFSCPCITSLLVMQEEGNAK